MKFLILLLVTIQNPKYKNMMIGRNTLADSIPWLAGISSQLSAEMKKFIQNQKAKEVKLNLNQGLFPEL